MVGGLTMLWPCGHEQSREGDEMHREMHSSTSLLRGPYRRFAAPNGHFLSPDSLAKANDVFLAKNP